MKSVLFLPLVLLIGVLAACNGGDDGPQDTSPGGQGGVVPPIYEEPKLLVEGDYLPVDFPFEELAKQGVAADAADAQEADFEGTIAGVRLYSFSRIATDPTIEKQQCVVQMFVEAKNLKFAYLPGGTYANGPEFAGICAGEETAFVMQQFTTKHGNFQIVFAYGEPAFGHDAPPERVWAEKIGDHEGVVISPLVPEGFGRGWASYATDNGIVIVDGHNLPTTELVKIAGGVECSGC